MLSLILARIFSICFILAILAGTIAVGTQLNKRQSAIRLSNGWQIGFLQPGLEVNAKAGNSRELTADTLIKYVCRDSNNNITASGMHEASGPMGLYGQKRMDEVMESKKASGDQCRLDTFYTVMGQRIPGDISGPEYQVDETPGAKHGFLPDSGIISRNPLVFADASSANRYFRLRSLNYSNKITENTLSTKTIRIQPANQMQQMGFAFHDLVKFGCISLLFLFLSRLFSNFSKQHFFTSANVRLLRNTGWLMLATPLVTVLLYFSFLQHMQPVKMSMDQNAEISSMISYTLTPDINWMLIIPGMSLLVLAFIFHDGLEMKEEEELTF